MIYLDYAASAPLFEEVIDLYKESLGNDFANPSSRHKLGRELTKKIEKAKTSLLSLIGLSDEYEVVFTGSATESNNFILKGLETRESILISKSEHPSLLECAAKSYKEIVDLPLNKGGLDFEKFSQVDFPSLNAIALSHINGQSGVIFDLKELATRAKEKNSKLHIHIDLSQSIGKCELDLPSNIDSYSLSSHKIGGPKGIAAIVFKKGAQIKSLLDGGRQDGEYRSSTINAPAIFSFVKALELSKDSYNLKKSYYESYYKKMKESLASLSVEFPFEDCVKTFCINTLVLDKIPSDVFMRHLEEEGVIVSTTSACSSKIKGDNPVLESLGIDKAKHKKVLRVSFGAKTSEQDIDDFISKFVKVSKDLRF